MAMKMLKKRRSSGTRFVKTHVSQGVKFSSRKLTKKEREKIKKMVANFSKLNKVEQRQAIKKIREKYPIQKRRKK